MVYDTLEASHQKFNAKFTAGQVLDIVIQALGELLIRNSSNFHFEEHCWLIKFPVCLVVLTGVGRQMKEYTNIVDSLFFNDKQGRQHRVSYGNPFANAISISDVN